MVKIGRTGFSFCYQNQVNIFLHIKKNLAKLKLFNISANL